MTDRTLKFYTHIKQQVNIHVHVLCNMETSHCCMFVSLFLTISQISHNYNAAPVFSGGVTHDRLRLGINMNK